MDFMRAKKTAEKKSTRELQADLLREWEKRSRVGRTAARLEVALEKYRCFVIRHSHRRSDAYDVYAGKKLVCTGGRVVVGEFLGRKLP